MTEHYKTLTIDNRFSISNPSHSANIPTLPYPPPPPPPPYLCTNLAFNRQSSFNLSIIPAIACLIFAVNFSLRAQTGTCRLPVIAPIGCPNP